MASNSPEASNVKPVTRASAPVIQRNPDCSPRGIRTIRIGEIPEPWYHIIPLVKYRVHEVGFELENRNSGMVSAIIESLSWVWPSNINKWDQLILGRAEAAFDAKTDWRIFWPHSPTSLFRGVKWQLKQFWSADFVFLRLCFLNQVRTLRRDLQTKRRRIATAHWSVLSHKKLKSNFDLIDAKN